MDYRLEKLKAKKEKARDRTERFSILQLLISALQRYLDCNGTEVEVLDAASDTMEILDGLSVQIQDQEDDTSDLLELVESIVEFVEEELSESPLVEDGARSCLDSLLAAETELERFNLFEYFEQIEHTKLQRQILGKAEALVRAEELEEGFYEQIAEALEDFLTGLLEHEELLSYLEHHYQSTLERLESYNNTQVKPEDWTIEVALADQFMLAGFEDWLAGLEALWSACEDPDCSDEDFLHPLEDLRLANRSWVLVEKLRS